MHLLKYKFYKTILKFNYFKICCFHYKKMLGYIYSFIIWSKQVYSPLRIKDAYAYKWYDSPMNMKIIKSKQNEEYDHLL